MTRLSEKGEKSLDPYSKRKDELSIEDGCLLWGGRVIKPTILQRRILLELHKCHPGMWCMKSLATSFVWWAGLDLDIEEIVRYCELCMQAANPHKNMLLLLWPWATESWQ